jgi:hypothetical protein
MWQLAVGSRTRMRGLLSTMGGKEHLNVSSVASWRSEEVHFWQVGD